MWRRCVLLVFLGLVVGKELDSECRGYVSCDSCLDDPNCGWCASNGVCVGGSSSGPSSGNCTNWLWTGCPSPSPTRSPMSPSPTPTPSATTVPFLPPLQTSSGWTAFGGNNAHTGFKAEFIGPLRVIQRWQKTLSGSLSYTVISNGTLYVTNSHGVLYALNQVTGANVSTEIAPGSYVGPPTIGYTGYLYIEEIGENEGVYVRAVGTNGQIAWTGSGSAQWSSFPYGTASSASLNLVYVPGGEYGGEMFAYNATTGIRRFTASLYGTGFGCDWWAPSVYQDNRVFFGTQPGGGNLGMIGEISATTGSAKWHVVLNSTWDGYSTYWVPVVSKGTAYGMSRVSSDLGITAIDIDTQKVMWSYHCTKPSMFPTSTIIDYSPASDGKTVFVTCVEGVFALSASDGSVQQKFDCTGCIGQPILTIDYVIVNSATGTQIFSRSTGTLVGSTQISGKISYQGGWLYITTNTQITAFQLRTN